jgi:replicative DNA helicase
MPFLKPDYFTQAVDNKIFNAIKGFSDKYNKPPTLEVLKLSANKDKTLSEDEYVEVINTLDDMIYIDQDIDWLVAETEQFCKDRALYNAMSTAVQIIDGKNKKLTPEAIPPMLEEALAIGFDSHIGHDFLDESEERFDYYHNVEERLAFDVEMFNTITNGGVPKKTLNVIMAGVGVGKTLLMSHLAAGFLAQGKNVLYITLEMSDKEIAKRIDANLLNVSTDDLMLMSRTMFQERMDKLRARTTGRLIIKEYPTGGGHAGHFNALINELWLKKKFKPHVVIVDYLNICASVRLKPDAAASTYTWVKAIAEEIRGLAVKHNVPIFSGTQTTRSGSVSNDPDMTDTAESFGLPATVDFYLALVQDEDMDEQNQYLAVQLKNRYRDKAKDRRFMIGVDKTKMRLYDTEKSAQHSFSRPSATETGPTRSKFRDHKFDNIVV